MILLCLSLLVSTAAAFATVVPTGRISTSLAAAAATATTLSETTTWKLSFVLQGLPTDQGKKVDEIFTIEAQFIEEEGYEPPQGSLRQVISPKKMDDDDDDSGGDGTENTPRFKVVNSRWQLSEDPNDRKDGLWVWGLFSDPLYPFLLLQLETEAIPLSGNGGDFIKPLKLFAQLNHQRKKEVGVLLKGDQVTIRELEVMRADPFGAATVDLYNDVTVGRLNVQPLSSA